MQNLYSVVISFANAGTAPSDGNIDNTTVAQYETTGAALATLANGLAKARANYRYKLLCQQLSLMGNIYTMNMVATGADANTAPSAFSFLAVVEHGDASLYVYDETNNNAILTGIPAIVRMIARALIISETTEIMYVDPTTSTANGNSTAYSRVGPRTDQETIGAVCANLTAANALITVEEIA